MGTDRIVDLYFTQPQHAGEVLPVLQMCWRRFGMHIVSSSDACEAEFKLGKFYLSTYPPNASLNLWVDSEYSDLDSLIHQLLVQDSSDQWWTHFYLADSRKRYFASVSASGVLPDEMTSIRLWMSRNGLVVFSERDKSPPDVDRLTCMSEKEKIKFVRKWEERQQELVELERQEYHFMRTLFAMLPDAVGLDLFITDPDLEDCISYCFTRGENLPEHLSKEKRLPEFEKWCDEHQPEYWQQFSTPNAS